MPKSPAERKAAQEEKYAFLLLRILWKEKDEDI